MTSPLWQPNGRKLYDRFPYKVQGSAEIELYKITAFEVQMEMIRERSKGNDSMGLALTPPGDYVKLSINGRLMMSSTDMEFITNLPFLDHARGDVLIGGLGLGLIIHELKTMKEVDSITVIENNPDVIALVQPTIPSDVTVIRGDVFTFSTNRRFDTTYMDIWENMTKAEDPEVERLVKRYKKMLQPGGVSAAWGLTPPSWRKPTFRAPRRSSRRLVTR